ncbi:MAG: AAA family ATPase [Thermodesulfobacteriota bacterium]|nr:AAA family ATPase [Thermodesulfobacteriota bacterium]
MEPVDRLLSYVEALRPIICIHHFDFSTVDQLITEAGKGVTIHEYNMAGQHVDFKTKCRKSENDLDLSGFLSYFDENEPQNTFLVLKDIHEQLNRSNVIAHLKSIALRTIYTDDYYVTVFIVSTRLEIPRELEKLITLFDLPLPKSDEIKALLDTYCRDLKIEIDDTDKYELTASLKGLTPFEIRQILNLAYQQRGALNRDDKDLILREKEQIIKKTGTLEIISVREGMENIGGLENLKAYLERKAKVFRNLGKARQFGVDPPKGILIAGMPGCGKSLTSKVVAQLFNVPLLRLDVGKLLGKYVGESEQNLRYAISTAEAVSPCVLWIDELEKAFAGIGSEGSGSEVTTRMFGHLLTWLQEKESAVYVVATSNDISRLPPEFMRKGRFDELFYVDFPQPEERRKIFEIHLKKRDKNNRNIRNVDTIKLLKATEGYSGGDIEAVVKEAMEDAFIAGEIELNTDILLKIIKNTRSISETLQEKIETMKKSLSKFDMKPASAKNE